MGIKPTLPNPKEETLARLICPDCQKLIGKACQTASGVIELQCFRCKSEIKVDLTIRKCEIKSLGNRIFRRTHKQKF